MENKKFLIIDGNSIMNRAYYGLMNMRMTSSILNIHTNALYAFLNIYWMTLDRFKPDYVVVSFDLKAPTFRHEMYKEYKGTRHAMPEELKEQMPVIKKILIAMNVPIIELEGYEADDILGTISNTNEKNNVYTYILTGDRDSFQLISSLTAVVMPSNKPGKTEYTVFDPQKLKEKYVFFDIDGTLSEYRYNDRLYASGDSELGCQSLEDLLFNDLFFQARPLKTMQKLIENLKSENIFILGAAVTNNEIEQKYRWLEKYYPNIRKEHIFFINSTSLKPEVILECCKHYNISVNDVAFVDDRLDALRKAESLGIKSYHPSSFTE